MFPYDFNRPIAVFLGPSLDRASAVEALEANYYPPARMGDIYRLIPTGVKTIVLIDGVFHGTVAVWQREIYDALAVGIRVIGAASMGALRAAELHPYGMIGLGTVFSWYRDGGIDGDDEVALIHADAEHHYHPFSEPLVNIRHNLAAAVQRGLISQPNANALIAHAKRLCFAERTYDMLKDAALQESEDSGQRDALITFLKNEGQNLKRMDALSALKYVADTPETKTSGGSAERRQSRYYQSIAARKAGFPPSRGLPCGG